LIINYLTLFVGQSKLRVD